MYQFYMGGVLLPVAPYSLTIKTGNQNETVTLINEGQINILKPVGLSKITFDALLPNREYPFARYTSGFKNAQYFMSVLENLKTKQKPFDFHIIRTDDSGTLLMTAESPMAVSLETYTIEENHDKYGTDVCAKIELLQYREYMTKKLVFGKTDGKTTATVSSKRDASTKSAETTYTVVSGDNLWSIARRKLGDGSRSSEIYTLNKSVIEAAAKKYGRASSSNGWWIYPGTVLKLPS